VFADHIANLGLCSFAELISIIFNFDITQELHLGQSCDKNIKSSVTIDTNQDEHFMIGIV
jgi:hypothetical protein